MQIARADDTIIVVFEENVYYVQKNCSNCTCKLICTVCKSYIYHYICSCVDNGYKMEYVQTYISTSSEMKKVLLKIMRSLSDGNQNVVTDDGIVQQRITNTITDVNAAIHLIIPI